MRRLVAFVIVAVSRVASAENEVSDGSAGSRSIASVTTVNRFGVLDAPAQAGDSTIQTRAELLVAGDLALLHVTQTSDALPIDGDTLRVEDAAVGQFALVRVKQVDGTTVTLTEPLARAWPAAFTQIVFVPQYASLTIESEGKLEAAAWDGRTGGVIAIAVAGELRNDGQIHADGRGFRGGSGGMADQSMFPSELTRNGEGLLRGEFPLLRAFAPTSTGGAIGRFFQAFSVNGGGGGGNATKGGKPPSIQNNSGGVGGLRIGSTGQRLFFGGGAAGTAQGNTFLLASGGAGGGAIVIFADSMTGSGRVSARGVSGATIDYEGRRHSSGGAGGTIVVELTGSLGCGALDASGAEGQSVTSCCVASAGGGAGRLFVSASSVACELRALSGTSGTFDGSRRDGEPSLPEPGEIDVREASRTAHPARRFTSCAAAPAPTTILLGLLVVLRRRQRS